MSATRTTSHAVRLRWREHDYSDAGAIIVEGPSLRGPSLKPEECLLFRHREPGVIDRHGPFASLSEAERFLAALKR